MSAARDVAAETRHRLSRAGKLREVLADGQWHTGHELARVVGHRFGASILVLRTGGDGGPPLDIRKERLKSDGSQWRYRRFGLLPRPHVPKERRRNVRALLAELAVCHALLRAAGVRLPEVPHV